jgi:tetrapyrrole methylase family protein/MazG family protein
VAEGISEKIIRRHPHVFGGEQVEGTRQVLANWEMIKRTEKKGEREFLVDGVPENLPALFRAEKIQRRVARVGFDWKDMAPVFDKVEEEFREFRQAVEASCADHAAEELGDILFALVNVARHSGICAEDALRKTINKFARRFRYIEKNFITSGKKLEDASLEDMDALWEESKKIVG